MLVSCRRVSRETTDKEGPVHVGMRPTAMRIQAITADAHDFTARGAVGAPGRRNRQHGVIDEIDLTAALMVVHLNLSLMSACSTRSSTACSVPTRRWTRSRVTDCHSAVNQDASESQRELPCATTVVKVVGADGKGGAAAHAPLHWPFRLPEKAVALRPPLTCWFEMRSTRSGDHLGSCFT